MIYNDKGSYITLQGIDEIVIFLETLLIDRFGSENLEFYHNENNEMVIIIGGFRIEHSQLKDSPEDQADFAEEIICRLKNWSH